MISQICLGHSPPRPWPPVRIQARAVPSDSCQSAVDALALSPVVTDRLCLPRGQGPGFHVDSTAPAKQESRHLQHTGLAQTDPRRHQPLQRLPREAKRRGVKALWGSVLTRETRWKKPGNKVLPNKNLFQDVIVSYETQLQLWDRAASYIFL